MKANPIIEKLLDKWVVKLICLMVAIFLYVFHQVSLVETKTFTVPLHIVEEGDLIHTSDVQKYISVIINANREEISLIHVDDIKAYITLNYLIEKGEHDLPVNIDLSERILSLDPVEIKVRPENIRLSCEKKVVKYIPAEASIAGEPAYGYEISDISIEPGMIEISGPESIVSETEKIMTTMIDVSGTSRPVEAKAGYIKLNPNISFDTNANFKVKVNVKPVISEKLFSDVPVTVKNLPTEFVIDSKIPAVSFSAKGALATLEAFRIASDTAQIDLSKVTENGKYEFPLKINLTSGLFLVSKSDEKITLEISRIPQLNEKEDSESEKSEVLDGNAAENKTDGNSSQRKNTEKPVETNSERKS